jgi:hypothetical protein
LFNEHRAAFATKGQAEKPVGKKIEPISGNPPFSGDTSFCPQIFLPLNESRPRSSIFDHPPTTRHAPPAVLPGSGSRPFFGISIIRLFSAREQTG